MLGDITGDLKYVTDGRGKRYEVILSFKVWKEIVEELESLREKQEILTGLQQACRDVKRQEKGENENKIKALPFY